MPKSPLPLWLKVSYTIWIALWATLYWVENGPQNFLWLCDLANWVALAGLWLESPLLLSATLVGVALAQVGWALDFFGRLALGFHPIGGTEYMFDAAEPLWLRALSLFHLWMLPFLIWLVRRTGYHRRGWLLQSALAVVILPVCYWFGPRSENLNWVWGPFGVEQTWMAPGWWLLCVMALYPLVLFYPAHLLLRSRLPSRSSELTGTSVT
jgi:hypothetical protein